MNTRKLFAIWYDESRTQYQISDVSYFGEGSPIKLHALQRMAHAMNVIMSIRASYFDDKIEFRLWVSPLVSAARSIEFSTIANLKPLGLDAQTGDNQFYLERSGDNVVIYFNIMGDNCRLLVNYNELLSACEIIANS